MKDESTELSREERLEYWQVCRILIDYKHRVITKPEAISAFSRQLMLPEGLGAMLFHPMIKMTIPELKAAFPDWIKKDMEPKFEDLTHAKRRGYKSQAG